MYNTFMNTICLSENTNIILKETLRSQGHELIEIKKTDAVYDAVSTHGDIYLCKLCNELVIAKEQFPLIQEDLPRCKIHFTLGTDSLGHQYPGNIKFNAAHMGKYLIHNRKYTDSQILRKANELGLQVLHVKQGYTKCNLVIVDENAAITSDVGLAVELKKHGIEVLLVSQGNVKLTGFPYGFLGGASGRVGNEIIFNGDLSAHPDFVIIKEFIDRRGLGLTYFKEYPLEDIGSIIQI